MLAWNKQVSLQFICKWPRFLTTDRNIFNDVDCKRRRSECLVSSQKQNKNLPLPWSSLSLCPRTHKIVFLPPHPSNTLVFLWFCALKIILIFLNINPTMHRILRFFYIITKNLSNFHFKPMLMSSQASNVEVISIAASAMEITFTCHTHSDMCYGNYFYIAYPW